MNREDEQATLVAFGSRVRAIRQGMNISQEELAAKAGLHRTYIGMIERGEKNATLISIYRIAKALKVLPSAIVDGGQNGK